MAAAAETLVNTMARLICRRFIVAPETKIIPCGRNAVKSQMLDVSRAWVAPTLRCRMAVKRWDKGGIWRGFVSLRMSVIRNGNLPRQRGVRDEKCDVRLQRFSAAQSCHFLQQEGRDVLSSHSGRLGGPQCRDDECIDFAARKGAFLGRGIGKQDARFCSLVRATFSRSPLNSHDLCSLLRSLHAMYELQAALPRIKR